MEERLVENDASALKDIPGNKPRLLKYGRMAGGFILSFLAVVLIFSMLAPTSQRIVRSIIIAVPANKVYEELIRLENINAWSVWNHGDSSIKLETTGSDGTIGATSSWRGDPEISGEGRLTIKDLQQYKKIVHSLEFISPKKMNAESILTLTQVEGGTKVTWEFNLATPRPWNVFNIFSSLDKKMGADFDESLANMKGSIEKKNIVRQPKNYEVMTMNFPASTYAQVRQVVKKDDMPAFFASQMPFIDSAIKNLDLPAVIPTGFFYKWDDNGETIDLAVAVEVPRGTKIENQGIGITNIPASKAIYVNFYGAYDKLADAYSSINKYLAGNKLKQKFPAIEQYISGPGREKDSSKWLTKVICLVE